MWWNSKPYSTYKYYKLAQKNECAACKRHTQSYLMQMTTWFGTIIPIFPITKAYFLVCSGCGEVQFLDKEEVKQFKLETKGLKPIKYNKYSELDLEDALDHTYSDVLMVGYTASDFKHNVKLHIRHIKSKKD